MADQRKVPGAKSPARKAAVAKSAPRSAGSTVRLAAKAQASEESKRVDPKPVEARPETTPAASKAAPRKARASKAAEARTGGTIAASIPASLFDAPPAGLVSAPASAARPDAAVAANLIAPVADLVAPAAGSAETVAAPAARLMATGESLRRAVAETTTATTRGAFEVNSKLIDAVRAQSDAAFDLWRSTVTAKSLSEAIRIQASGVRHAYETAATHWKDLADSTTRWFGSTVRSIQSAWTDRTR
jgi:hypothetical protein